MKRLLFAAFALVAASASTGCNWVPCLHCSSDPTFSNPCCNSDRWWQGDVFPADGEGRWGRVLGHPRHRERDGLGWGCNCNCPEDGYMHEGHLHGRGGRGRGQAVSGMAYDAYGNPIPEQAPPGMSAATVAYPYYTTRGPRDFLLEFPNGIGP